MSELPIGPQPRKKPHSWPAYAAADGWETCKHCGLQRQDRGRNGWLLRHVMGGQTWGSGTMPPDGCTGPEPDPDQGDLFA